MDAASNRSVDDIRDLRERVGYAPAAGRWKVYILDEAHMLTREAWNAFLKTLEEPPPQHGLRALHDRAPQGDADDRGSLPALRLPAPFAGADRRGRAARGRAPSRSRSSDGAVAAIARSAGGSFRDALGTLDQLVAYGGKQVATDDVLAVLGVAEAELILAAADAIASEDGQGRPRGERAPEPLGPRRRPVRARPARPPAPAARRSEPWTTSPRRSASPAADPERLRAQAESFSELALVRAIDTIAEGARGRSRRGMSRG